jgi:GT2 family glycosyltransferase
MILPKYTVIVPFFNNALMTKRCVDSIFATATPDEVICVDNGSTSKFTCRKAKVIRLGRNYGFPRAVNVGVQHSKYEFVVVLHNDVIMKPGWDRVLLSALKDPSVGMSGQSGGKLDASLNFVGNTETNPDYMEMFCVAFRRRTVWKKVGPLDEGMGRGYSEDSDWGIRARKMGYRFAVVPDCCTHVGAATFGNKPDIQELKERNRARLMERHYNGSVLWLSNGANSSITHALPAKLIEAMSSAGWNVNVFVGHAKPWKPEGTYDVVVLTSHDMMPLALEVDAKYRFALIQSDEPEYCVGYEEEARQDFLLPGFHHIITSDSMLEFGSKYNMTIVGKVEAGVDDTVFYPTWKEKREWPNGIVAFHGPGYSPQHIRDRFRDTLQSFIDAHPGLVVKIISETHPGWPCSEHYPSPTEPERRVLYNEASLVLIDLWPPDQPQVIPLEAMASGCPIAFIDDLLGFTLGMSYPANIPELLHDKAWLWSRYLNGLVKAQHSPWSVQQQKFLDIINSVIGR